MKKIGLVSLFFLLVGALYSQTPVQPTYDYFTHIEAVAQTKAILSGVRQQIQVVEQMYKDAERDIRQMTTLPARIFNTAVDYVQDQIDTVEGIGRDFESLTLTVGESIMHADKLFMTDEKLEGWLDPNITPEQRKELIEEDVERAKVFKKLNREAILKALEKADVLRKQILDSRERIKEMSELIRDDKSFTAQLQANNALLTEILAMLYAFIELMMEMNQQVALQGYEESIKDATPPAAALNLYERDCTKDEYRDPISFDCNPKETKSTKEILEEALVDDIDDAGWMKAIEENLMKKKNNR